NLSGLLFRLCRRVVSGFFRCAGAGLRYRLGSCLHSIISRGGVGGNRRLFGLCCFLSAGCRVSFWRFRRSVGDDNGAGGRRRDNGGFLGFVAVIALTAGTLALTQRAVILHVGAALGAVLFANG